MDGFFSDDPRDARPGRTLADVQAPPAHPVWIAILAALGGLVIPAIAAIAAAVLLGPPSVQHASQLAKIAGAALTVAEAIFAGLGAAALVEAGWRRIGLPGSGPANFLPLRYIRHRLANKHVKELIDQLRNSPAQPSRESLHALLDLSRELARRDIYTRAHSGRVSRLCVELGQRIGLSPEDCEIARLSGLLHDIGKLEIPASILNKPGPLDPDEAELVRNHPAIGAALVAPYIGADVVNAVRHHHERVDGAGYPDGVDSDALPIIARLVPVVDTYDALISDRSYRPGRSREEAFLEMRAVAGTQLDAELVDALIEMESAKVPFGGAVLGLAPVGALLRRAEHLLHNSAAPAAAAITAIAVAGAGWLGVMSGGAAANTANGPRPSSLAISPTPKNSPSPDAQAPVTPASPIVTTDTPPPQPTASVQNPIIVFTGNKSGGTVVVPKSSKTTQAVSGPSTSKNTGSNGSTIISVGPPASKGSGTPSGGGTTSPPASPTPTRPGSSPPPPPPAPAISSISPTSGPVSTLVTINGTNLTGAAISFGAYGATVKTAGASSMVVFAPPGSGAVVVTAKGPGGSSSSVLGLGDTYTYVGPNVTSISDDGTPPKGGDAFGVGGSSLTISGSNLLGASSVTLGTTNPCPITSNTNTTIVCTVPAFSGTQRELVYVTTPAGGPASPSSGGEFNYGPNVTGVSPSSGVAGTPVTISGSNLSGATDATFNGVSVPINVNSDTSADAVAPDPSKKGAINVVVDNSAGSSATGTFDRFTWTAPSISGLSPSMGLAGIPLTISGVGFTAATSVTIGGTAATFNVASDGSISTTVPATLVAGAASVIVTTPAGTSAGSTFTVTLPPPTVGSMLPNTGVSNTVTSVVITGSNLGGATVTLSTGGSATVTSAGTTSITVDIPASGAIETADVTVTTQYGTADAGSFSWTS